jgi:hypothetical protein
MATNAGNGSPRGPSPLISKPSRPSFGRRREKDENVAKTAGVVVAGGIAWSLFRSISGFGTAQKGKIHTVSTDIKQDVEHAVKEVEQQKEVVLTRSPKIKKKNGKGKRIEVKDGDTLYGIARKHNVSVSALMASNGMKDGDSILAGEFITIPKEKE